MKQKRSQKARSLLLKGRSIWVCSLFLIVFALVSLPIRKTEAQIIPMPKEDAGDQTHESWPEVWVFYEQWRIRISDWEQTIYVKDRNQWATVSVSEYEEAEKTLKLSSIKDNYEWCLNYICENDCWDGDICNPVIKCIDVTECKSEQVKNANEILWGDVTEDNILYKINDYLSNHESDMEIVYEDTFWTYYYRWNNVWASRNEIHDKIKCLPDEYCPQFIEEDTYLKWFDGWKIWEPDTWREGWEYDNPCDITKWEYLPTAEDWQRMLDIYGNTILDVKDDTIQSKKAGEDIRDVLRIPEAWNIYYFNKQAAKWWDSELQNSNYVYTPISNNYTISSLLWLASYVPEAEAYVPEESKDLKKVTKIRLSVDGESFYSDKWNDVATPVRCFIDPELIWEYYKITFETNGGNTIASKYTKGWVKLWMFRIITPIRDWYIFDGWYFDEDFTQEVGLDMVITQNITLYAKRIEKGVFYRNGYIKVSDWENTIYIKDRNQWAEMSLKGRKNQLQQLEELGWCREEIVCVRDCNCNPNVQAESTVCKPLYQNKLTCPDNYFEDASSIIWYTVTSVEEINKFKDNYDEYEDPNYIDTFGTYYYRWNNSGVNYYELDLDENIIMNTENLIESWFDEWKLTDNYKQKWDNNPCDTNKWEYLPTVEDWQTAMDIWREVGYNDTEYNDGEATTPGAIGEKLTEWNTNYKAESQTAMEQMQSPEVKDTDKPTKAFPIHSESNDGNNLLSKWLSRFLNDMLIPSAWYIFNEEKLSQLPVADNGGKEDDKIDEGFAAKKRNWLQEENNDKWLEDKELEEKEKESTINETEKPKEKNLYEKIYNYGYISLWTDKGINGMIWTLTLEELSYFDESYDKINSLATPVRCFVKVNKVSFNTNWWSRMDEMEMLWNETLKWLNIKNPTRAGYTFAGWYTDPELTQPFDSSDPVTENTVLYARWEINNTNNYVEDEQPITYNNWWRLRKDKCPGWDFSDSYYDWKCGSSTIDTHSSATTEKTESPYQKWEELKYDTLKYNPKYSDEMNQAYQYAYYYGITTKESIKSADVDWKLTRVAMAKMLSQYAINVLWMKPDNTVTKKFSDVSNKLDADYDNWVTLAYQLWIMWINMPDNKFRPNDSVTRAEFVTALSRMKYWTKDGRDVYYSTHMNLLKDLWVITVTDPTLNETRWYVMLMLMRAK